MASKLEKKMDAIFLLNSPIVQLVERHPVTVEVAGSCPVRTAIKTFFDIVGKIMIAV